MSKLENIGPGHSLIAHGDYVIVKGKSLYIFLKDGTLIAQRKDLKNTYKVAFASQDRLVVDAGSSKDYRVISLLDGQDVGSIARPRMDYTALRFATSIDGNIVYDFYFNKVKCHIIKLDLNDYTETSFRLQHGLRATADIAIDEDENLCILQGQCETVAGKEIYSAGIRYELFDPIFGLGNALNWKAKWTFLLPRMPINFFDSADTIITSDLQVYDPQKETMWDLLENNAGNVTPGNSTLFFGMDESNRYAFIHDHHATYVVDKEEKKVVGRYYSEFFTGSIVNDEFWMFDNTGFIRKPFPHIEESREIIPRFRPIC